METHPLDDSVDFPEKVVRRIPCAFSFSCILLLAVFPFPVFNAGSESDRGTSNEGPGTVRSDVDFTIPGLPLPLGGEELESIICGDSSGDCGGFL